MASPATGDPPKAIFQRYVAYVSRNEQCRGTAALRTAMKPVQEDVMIVEVENLSRREVPPWLKGTPCLVDMSDGKRMAYHGTDAVQHMNASVEALNTSSAPDTLDGAPPQAADGIDSGFGAATEAGVAPVGERPSVSRDDNDRDALEAAVMREQEARASSQPRPVV